MFGKSESSMSIIKGVTHQYEAVSKSLHHDGHLHWLVGHGVHAQGDQQSRSLLETQTVSSPDDCSRRLLTAPTCSTTSSSTSSSHTRPTTTRSAACHDLSQLITFTVYHCLSLFVTVFVPSRWHRPPARGAPCSRSVPLTRMELLELQPMVTWATLPTTSRSAPALQLLNLMMLLHG